MFQNNLQKHEQYSKWTPKGSQPPPLKKQQQQSRSRNLIRINDFVGVAVSTPRMPAKEQLQIKKILVYLPTK